MAERETTYVPGDLLQAAAESRAWADVARAHAGVHEAMASQLEGTARKVAKALAAVARDNAEHAVRMAERYEQGAAACR